MCKSTRIGGDDASRSHTGTDAQFPHDGRKRPLLSRRGFLGKLASSLLPALILSLSFLGSAARAQLNGAIFTTDSTGLNTNLNIYASKGDVYLNGGPRQPGAAGLPDGEYYVQVTEPNGTLLGTSVGAADETPVVVVGGEFVTPYQLSAILIKASDGTPGYDTTSNNGGEYKVWVSQGPGFINSQSKTDNFKVLESNTPDPTIDLSGLKFFDANADGVRGNPAVEVGLAGFRINVFLNGVLYDPNSLGYTTVTGSGGTWSVLDVPAPAGTLIRVVEVLPGVNPDGSYWLQTAPAFSTDGSAGYEGTSAGADITGLDFGNVSVVRLTGGRTLGFWSNKNGQALIGADDLAMLSALNLVDGNGAAFNPANYASLRTWLLNGNAVNMAYMLSVQLSATSLSVHNGLLSDSTIVLLLGQSFNGSNLADCYGANLASIGAMRTEANAMLGADGYTPAGDANREHQECLKNILDAINNNAVPALASGPVAITYP